jgi:hypothetical protein
MLLLLASRLLLLLVLDILAALVVRLASSLARPIAAHLEGNLGLLQGTSRLPVVASYGTILLVVWSSGVIQSKSVKSRV